MNRDQIIDHFSSSQGRRDQAPNKELAEKLVSTVDLDTIEKLIEITDDESIHSDQVADALKVLEMVGEQKPEWISKAFYPSLHLLDSKENKLVWRAMIIISLTSSAYPDETFDHLGSILQTMDQGSVITRDHGIKVLLQLYNSKYQAEVRPLILEQILSAPDNQLGQYAEKWSKIISKEDIPTLLRTLEQRQAELTHPSHQKRTEKIVLKLRKQRK